MTSAVAWHAPPPFPPQLHDTTSLDTRGAHTRGTRRKNVDRKVVRARETLADLKGQKEQVRRCRLCGCVRDG